MRVGLSGCNTNRKSVFNKNKVIGDSESKQHTVHEHIAASVTWSSLQMKNISEKKTGFKRGWMYIRNTLMQCSAFFWGFFATT